MVPPPVPPASVAVAPDDARPAPAPRAIDAGRLGVYAALGASAGALPLPWIPDVLARRVRGALARDVAVRHGVVLSPGARQVLADPADPDRAPRTLVQLGARFLGARLAARTVASFAPIGLYWPAHGALKVYVLGRLLDRYLREGRRDAASAIDEAEARRVRRAIDGALLGALASGGRFAESPASGGRFAESPASGGRFAESPASGGRFAESPASGGRFAEPLAPGGSLEGARGRSGEGGPAAGAATGAAGWLGPAAVTELVDRVLSMAAAIPEHLLRRLDAAFDEGLAHGRI